VVIDQRDWFTTMRWGDPLFAGLAGSTARWDAWEPAAWQVQQAFALPEPMPVAALASAQQAYDATFGTAGRQASMAATWCRYLPPNIRVLLAPCLGEMVGERARERLEAEQGKVLLVVIAAGLVLIGAAALVWGR
jgi:hypothetical protein